MFVLHRIRLTDALLNIRIYKMMDWMGAAEIQIRKESSVGLTLTGKYTGILHANQTNTDTRLALITLLFFLYWNEKS